MSIGRRNSIAVAIAAAACAALWLVGVALREAPVDKLAVAADVGDADSEPDVDDGAGRETAVYRGSWHFPRGGPYILGIQGDARARLSIDGVALDLRPWRGHDAVRLARRVFGPGVYAVELRAPPGARLLWHPPGRRGPPEYVPPSSLSPEPPDRATFSRPGAYPVDAALATGMLLVIVALAAFLARDALRSADRRALAAAAVVFAVAVAVRLVDLGGAGQTWDEDVNWSAGRNYVINLLAGDFDARSWIWNLEHPPFTKYLLGIGALWSDGYGPARALSALAVAAACALLVPIGGRLFSLRVGAIAGGVASLMPHLVAHGKVAGHEATAVLWWTLTVWLCLRVHAPVLGHSPSRRRLAARLALVGVGLGLAAWSRFASALLAPLVGLVLVVTAPLPRRRALVALGLAIVPAVALAVGVAGWPRLWHAPVHHLAEAWARLSVPHDPEPYLGVVTNRPPWHYFWVYALATTPLGVWLAVACAPLRRSRDREVWRSWLVVGLWFVVPFGVMASPVRQDGVRYVLPALMPVALAAAVGIDAVTDRLGDLLRERLGARHRAVALLVPAAFAGYLGATAASAHPYYLDYYGEHVGGTAGAYERRWFETGWWGEGIHDAIAYLNQHAAPGARVDKRRLHPAHLAWMRHDLWAPQARHGPFPAPDAEWLLVNQWPFEPPPGWSVVYDVTAGGAPLVRVYRRASSAKESAESGRRPGTR